METAIQQLLARASKTVEKVWPSLNRAETKNIHVCALLSVASKLSSSFESSMFGEDSAFLSLSVQHQIPKIRFRKR